VQQGADDAVEVHQRRRVLQLPLKKTSRKTNNFLSTHLLVHLIQVSFAMHPKIHFKVPTLISTHLSCTFPRMNISSTFVDAVSRTVVVGASPLSDKLKHCERNRLIHGFPAKNFPAKIAHCIVALFES
jgi:hypothetical protein